MKRFLAVSLSILVLCSAYGRDKDNEIALSYSQFTTPQFVYLLGGMFGMVFSMGNVTLENMAMPGALSLEYTRFVNKTFGFGGSITADYMTADKYIGKDADKTYDGKFRMFFLSVMPHAKAYWFDNPHFGMYSKVGAGCALVPDEAGSTSLSFAAQLSPVCMDFGGDSFRGFLELGVGMQGIFSLGIRKRF